MQIVKYAGKPGESPRIGVIDAGRIQPFGKPLDTLSSFLFGTDPEAAIRESLSDSSEVVVPVESVRLLAPIDRQEVWGAGVTYERSKVARQEESEQGGSFYDLVYTAPRPELFFKATPSRVVGPGEPIRVRQDTKWCVPEPELTLVISPDMKVVGYTIGNDVSARDIEGVNPLYLPQAKVYDACAAIGPVITLASSMPPIREVEIRLEIERAGQVINKDSTSLSRMARTLEELVDWLGRENRYPDGVFLMTGTGIVPPDDFSLEPGDLVRISIDGIGTLVNPVIRGPVR